MTATSDETPVPPALTSAVLRWRDRGEPSQPASSWSRDSWRKQFPDHRSFLDALPEHIDRGEATRHAAHAVTPEGAELAFLVAMIWGYGRVGYGAWRTARVLTENPHAVDRLAEVARVAQEHGGLAAFQDLADKPLRYLGVAFGTKYLRFVTAAQSSNRASAPILDAVVRRWLATHADVRLNIDEWRPEVYGQYFALLTLWSTKLDLTADTVEELIFRSAISPEGSAQDAQATFVAVERLFDTADPQLAQEARPHLDELARIIQQGWAN